MRPMLDVETGEILAEQGVAAIGADNFAIEAMARGRRTA